MAPVSGFPENVSLPVPAAPFPTGPLLGDTVAAGFEPRSYDLVSFFEVSAQMPGLISPCVRDSGPAVSLESLN